MICPNHCYAHQILCKCLFYKADLFYANFTNANARNVNFAKTDCSKVTF
ncbi:pentapeptide repeat-containing protein [Lysinibacillus xylanilyticus]|nr:pentapeptide repeat-containing protein [Lysinibacillus xylanilyticus]